MTPTRNESEKKVVEHVKPNSKKSIKESEEKKVLPLPKTSIKRKHEESEIEGPDAKKMDWLKTKAKEAVIPEEKNAKLKPEFLFKEKGPLIIHLCSTCKSYNGSRQAETIEQGMIQLPLAMCSVCRHHLNQQRNLRFFHHELPSLKKNYQL